MKVQVRVKGNQTSFSSPLLPNSGLTIDNCSNLEMAKGVISAYIKNKSGQEVEFQDIASNDEFLPFIFGVHI